MLRRGIDPTTFLRRARSLQENSYSLHVSCGMIRSLHKCIPRPTWSIKALGLKQDETSAEPLSPAFISSLSKRALIRIAPDDVEQRQNLANMMQLIHQVVEWNQERESAPQKNVVELYDLPRGVKAAPLRSDEHRLTTNHPAIALDDKTVSVGAHKYFTIQTRRRKGSSDDPE